MLGVHRRYAGGRWRSSSTTRRAVSGQERPSSKPTGVRFATDPDSPFGGILISNQTWTLDLAREVDEIFTEVLIAPDFAADALDFLRKKKNRRLMRWHRR